MSNAIYLSFIDGPKVEVIGDAASSYYVRFMDADSGWVVYDSRIATNNWCAASLRYYVKWRVTVEENGVLLVDETLDLKGKKVFIQLGSKSLGDTIAWMPYALEFQRKHGCEVIVATHWNEIFDYPQLRFIQHGEEKLNDYTAAYRVNAYDNDLNRNKNNWRLIPLQQVATDYLGLDFKELHACIRHPDQPRPIDQKYVAISEFTTFHGKQWNLEGGWQELCDELGKRGYKVASVSKEPSSLANVEKWNGRGIADTINNVFHADLVVTVATGLAWLAWSMGKKVVIVSGMTPTYMEMTDCVRVQNPSVCNSCYGDLRHPMDRGNWRWCPRTKNFECSTTITPKMVLDAIDGVATAAPEKRKTLDEIALHHGTDKASWGHNYTPIYETLFRRMQDLPLTILEIGVLGGASIRTWLDYFPQAIVYGIDCSASWKCDHPRFRYRIGDQRDPEFLRKVAEEAGQFDLVVDDGCHAADAIRASFHALWPHVKAGGHYIVEDCFDLFGQHFDHGLCVIRKHLAEHPRFSLIMPTKDRPEMVKRAVKAILDQDYVDWELIIMDAGQSVAYLLPHDPRIKYERCLISTDADEKAWGPAVRFNLGLQKAKGEIFNFCADDDVMRPGTLSFVHENIGEAKWFYGRIQRSDTGAIQGEDWNAAECEKRNIVPAPAAFWKRAAYNELGGWDTSLITADWDYWKRLGAKYAPATSSRVLVDYTVHPEQETSAQAQRMEAEVAASRRRRVLMVAPHCSTGGMPEYLFQCVRVLRGTHEIAVVEWSFHGEQFVVQRNKIKALCPLMTLNGSKGNGLFESIKNFRPDVIHLQEFPELFMDEATIARLYAPERNYKLIETAHSTKLRLADKRTRPDQFVFVSDYHKREFADYGVPAVVAEYVPEPKVRPERAKALEGLRLDPDRVHVLNVGIFTPGKNQGEAFEVAHQMPELEFHFVGSLAPNFYQYWKPLQENLPANCRLWGERDDVDRFYSACDAFLFTSVEELNPLVVKESIAWRLPIFMRNLPVYCGKYDDPCYDGLVYYITGVEDAVQQLRQRFPAMKPALTTAYT